MERTGPSNAAPAVGHWSFGPADTFSQTPIANPAVNNGNNPGNAVLNAGANSLTWDFGTFADPRIDPVSLTFCLQSRQPINHLVTDCC